MRWVEVRAAHPDRWLVIEALEAHTCDAHRMFDRIAVVEVCADGPSTMKRCAQLHRQHPQRELCFVHTAMVELDIEERRWIGIRGIRATDPSLFLEHNDRLRVLRGVGGREFVFVRRVERLAIADRGLDDFEVEIGEMDYGFEIGEILGMDFLRAASAVIDLRALTIEFA